MVRYTRHESRRADPAASVQSHEGADPGAPKVLAMAAAAWLILTAMTTIVSAQQAQDPRILGFKKKFIIEIGNPGSLPLENLPLVLRVDDVRRFAPDFNSYYYGIFDETGGDYRLVVSQADDLDKDRYHDEIVLIRTLPSKSLTRLACYYSPRGSFQLMSTAKTFARPGWEPGVPAAGWESSLAAFKFADGRVEAYGKLYAGFVLQKIKTDDGKLQEWGMRLLGRAGSSGLGGLSLWEGKSVIPLAPREGLPAGAKPKVSVVASGPLRALVKAEYAAVPTSKGDRQVSVLFSAFADNAFFQEDVVLGPAGGEAAVVGLGVQKLMAESSVVDKDKGILATWGRGAEGVGDIGLAAIFPQAAVAGIEESGPERSIRLTAVPGKKLTCWLAAAWDRGISAPPIPAPRNWAARIAGLAERLRTSVEVRFTEK